MKKFAYFILVLVLLGGGYYFYDQKNKQVAAPTLENSSLAEETQNLGKEQQPAAEPKASPSSKPTTPPAPGNGSETQGTFSPGEEGMAPDVLVVQVDFDGTAFSPKTVAIKVGDIVIFKNNASGQMWPASAPHPSHTDYPEFDPKQAIAVGGKWQFKFSKKGAWRFHDHLNPTANGTVNVE